MRATSANSRTGGFTLVEVLVIAPVVLLIIAAFVGMVIRLSGDALSARAANTLAYTIQDALDTIERDVRYSGAFLAQTNVAIIAPQGRAGDTTPFTNITPDASAALILNAYATTDSPVSETRQLIPLPDLPVSCTDPAVGTNQPLTYNIVYFIRDNTLWRRTIMPSNYTSKGCNSLQPWQRPSCAPGASLVAPSFCRIVDVRLVEGVMSLELAYSAAPGGPAVDAATTGVTPGDRQTALDTTSSVRVTITATSSVAGRDVSRVGSLSATRLGDHNAAVTPVP